MKFVEKIAVLTGAGSDICAAMVAPLLNEGASVVLVDVDLARVQAIVSRFEPAPDCVLALQADITQPDQIEAAVRQTLDTFGRIDILVNAAASYRSGDAHDASESEWLRDIDVTLNGALWCSRAVLPTMMEQRRGVIVNIASVNGINALGNMAYSAAKAGMINLTQNMAVRYGPYNIRVNAVCPGTVRTSSWDSRLAARPSVLDDLAQWYPLGRIGEPEDVAKATLFLASDDAAWITGTSLIVDGGLLAGSYRMARELTLTDES